jgi:hypothetical protein
VEPSLNSAVAENGWAWPVAIVGCSGMTSIDTRFWPGAEAGVIAVQMVAVAAQSIRQPRAFTRKFLGSMGAFWRRGRPRVEFGEAIAIPVQREAEEAATGEC